jgi:hypothetical protein
MNREAFQKDMGRLMSQFPNAYGPERVNIVFRAVGQESSEWWARTVDHFLGAARHAPLLEDINTLLSQERERRWAREKQQHAQDAKDFFSGSYQPDDVKQICQTIIKRMKRGISDDDWSKFVGLLEETARMTTRPGERGR